MPESVATEADVEDALTATLKATAGLVVVLGSAQNIDRLVTVYRATIKAGRRLAVDLYTAEVAASTGRDTIPQVNPDWPKIAAYLPLRQRIRVKRTGQFHRTAAVKPQRIFDEDLAAAPGGWVLFGAFQGHVPHLLKAGLLDRRGRGLVHVGRLPHRPTRPAVRRLAGAGRCPADPPPHLRARQPRGPQAPRHGHQPQGDRPDPHRSARTVRRRPRPTRHPAPGRRVVGGVRGPARDRAATRPAHDWEATDDLSTQRGLPARIRRVTR